MDVGRAYEQRANFNRKESNVSITPDNRYVSHTVQVSVQARLASIIGQATAEIERR